MVGEDENGKVWDRGIGRGGLVGGSYLHKKGDNAFKFVGILCCRHAQEGYGQQVCHWCVFHGFLIIRVTIRTKFFVEVF